MPPESLAYDGVAVRRWRVTDADALHACVTANVEHLRTWMPWIQFEPLTVDDRRTLLATWENDWDEDREFAYAILDESAAIVGSCGLHRRSTPEVIEIGYWLDHAHTGLGLATRAVRALVDAAHHLDGVTTIEIRHDAANLASGHVAARAGFTRTVQSPPVWSLELDR